MAAWNKSGKAEPGIIWYSTAGGTTSILGIDAVASSATAADLLALAKSHLPTPIARVKIKGKWHGLGYKTAIGDRANSSVIGDRAHNAAAGARPTVAALSADQIGATNPHSADPRPVSPKRQPQNAVSVRQGTGARGDLLCASAYVAVRGRVVCCLRAKKLDRVQPELSGGDY